MDRDVSSPLGDPCLSLYSLEEQGYKVSILFGTIQCLAVHVEQRRARLDLVGWATSDGVAHVLSCGYWWPYPHSIPLLANPVLVKKKIGKWRMYVEYTGLNKACPKDHFPLPHIDQIVDSSSGCEILFFLDAYSGYH